MLRQFLRSQVSNCKIAFEVLCQFPDLSVLNSYQHVVSTQVVLEAFYVFRDPVVLLFYFPWTVCFSHGTEAILFPAGMIVPAFTIPLLSDLLPFIMGSFRVKGELMKFDL